MRALFRRKRTSPACSGAVMKSDHPHESRIAGAKRSRSRARASSACTRAPQAGSVARRCARATPALHVHDTIGGGGFGGERRCVRRRGGGGATGGSVSGRASGCGAAVSADGASTLGSVASDSEAGSSAIATKTTRAAVTALHAPLRISRRFGSRPGCRMTRCPTNAFASRTTRTSKERVSEPSTQLSWIRGDNETRKSRREGQPEGAS